MARENIGVIKLLEFDYTAAHLETPEQQAEFIFENAPFPQCHASTIAETKAGLVAAWFGGTREKNPEICRRPTLLRPRTGALRLGRA